MMRTTVQSEYDNMMRTTVESIWFGPLLSPGIHQQSARPILCKSWIRPHLDGHVANVCILWALHKDKRWVSGVLNHHLIRHLTRSYIHTKRKSVSTISSRAYIHRLERARHMHRQTTHSTCSDHGDGGLDVDPLVSVDPRVHEDQPFKMSLLYPS